MINTIKGILVLVFSLPALVLPTVIAVLGYFAFFCSWELNYIAIVVGLWGVSIFIVPALAVKSKMGIFHELVGGALGWVYLLSIPASIYFFVAALFMGASWWEFAYSILVGTIAKGFAVTHNQLANQQ